MDDQESHQASASVDISDEELELLTRSIRRYVDELRATVVEADTRQMAIFRLLAALVSTGAMFYVAFFSPDSPFAHIIRSRMSTEYLAQFSFTAGMVALTLTLSRIAAIRRFRSLHVETSLRLRRVTQLALERLDHSNLAGIRRIEIELLIGEAKDVIRLHEPKDLSDLPVIVRLLRGIFR